MSFGRRIRKTLERESKSGPLVIAEVAQSHDGSLGLAHCFIDAVAETGADAIKFQTHIASAESSPEEPWRIKFSPQDSTRFDYWRRMEFSEDQWRGLRVHAEEKGLLFISSPFSDEAFELLSRVGVAAWKVASGEVGNTPLLRRMAASGKPVWLSSGLSDFAEIEAAMDVLQPSSNLALLQCSTSYPTPAAAVGLNVMDSFRQRYACDVGISDHSGTVFPALAAATLGADIIEVHVALSRRMFGPDVKASVTVEELSLLCAGTSFIATAMANPVDKLTLPPQMDESRRIFTKSIHYRLDLGAGTVLNETHFGLRKPGIGIPASILPQLVGRTLVRDVHANERASLSDFKQD